MRCEQDKPVQLAEIVGVGLSPFIQSHTEA
jgi:hypothetical protein